MKYCPYCGASLLEDAAFCMSCGKTIPLGAMQEPDEVVMKKSRVKPGRKRPAIKKSNRQPEQQTTKDADGALQNPHEDGYDGYYDDVLPTDEGSFSEKLDKALVKRIIWVAAGAIAIIALSFVLMQVL